MPPLPRNESQTQCPTGHGCPGLPRTLQRPGRPRSHGHHCPRPTLPLREAHVSPHWGGGKTCSSGTQGAGPWVRTPSADHSKPRPGTLAPWGPPHLHPRSDGRRPLRDLWGCWGPCCLGATGQPSAGQTGQLTRPGLSRCYARPGCFSCRKRPSAVTRKAMNPETRGGGTSGRAGGPAAPTACPAPTTRACPGVPEAGSASVPKGAGTASRPGALASTMGLLFPLTSCPLSARTPSVWGRMFS